MGSNESSLPNGDQPASSSSSAPVRADQLDEPLSRLVLTDQVEQKIDQFEDPTEEEIMLLGTTRENLMSLKTLGAQGPYYGISGLIDEHCEQYDKWMEAYNIGLVFWGSPHWSEVKDRSRFRFRCTADFKTNAFGSMSWHSPSAFVLMTFPEKYGVEFYQPKYNEYYASMRKDPRIDRCLFVTEGAFRQYKPLASGSQYYEICKQGKRIMVAMLVPQRFMPCVHWRDEKIDVGRTLLSVLNRLSPHAEIAMELGGQSFSLSMEIILAMDSMQALKMET